MRIAGKEFQAITISDKDGGLLVSMTDDDVIIKKDCVVKLTAPDPEKKGGQYATERK